jgi:hypothetical protein
MKKQRAYKKIKPAVNKKFPTSMGMDRDRSRLIRNKEEEQVYLDLLNHHFKTVTAEKHPDAMLNLIFRESYEKVLGVSFAKERIGKRKAKAIRNLILLKLQKKYGRWINLTNFKIKNINQCLFMTNFNRVYNVEGQGKLYGNPSHSISGGVFYTEHCLERFEERVSPHLYEPVTERLRFTFKAEPTSADIMFGLVMSSNLEHGVWKEFKYLNINVGALVLEDLGDVFIAKTFLTPDMLYADMKWYQALIQEGDQFHYFADLLKHECIKIEQPDFLINRLAKSLDPETIEKIMKGNFEEIKDPE